MTPPPLDIAKYFQSREQSAYQAYQDSVKHLVDYYSHAAWHDAADMRGTWLITRDDKNKALGATPCQHTAAERSHEAQRCDWCWTLSTYVRLTTPKENDTNE